jgi:hypothetical protein
MEVNLDTVAQSMQPYLLFDDIGGGLRSNTLNRWTTESWHTGRKFHSNSEMYRVPNVTQVFVTANDLKTSEDIQRRALIIELFLEEEVKGRKFNLRITPQWLGLEETRSSFLAACNAIVRAWLAKDQPLHTTPLETYEEWTSIMGGMVTCCDFADPLAAPEGVVGGAVDEDEIKQLLIAAATRQEGDCTLTRDELIKIARAEGLLEDMIGTQGDVDDTANKRFGRKMQRWRGQKLKDRRDPARTFQFSHKRKKSGATYPLVFLDGKRVTAQELAIETSPAASAADDEPGDED